MKGVYSLEELEKRIGYRFQRHELLKQALTHSSHANEQKIRKSGDYERLEFLGDAVLELLTSEFLFYEHPDMPEGKLTRLRSSIVCEPALAGCAKKVELGKFILLGKGEEATGGRERESIIADVLEALIGAMYLDGGFSVVREFVRGFILADSENKVFFHDSKTILQEMIQTRPNQQLVYELLEESGPDHNKEFTVQALLNDKRVGFGRGRTKKAAEQQAAYEAILLLKEQEKK
ncbi:MAG: ribonuclease III [Lachnospiraceae bacterium]|nr:ribonuclease III [Lachnospiraceae bacterium]